MDPRSGNPITIRRLHLAYPPALDPVIIDGHPEESGVVVGLSLLLPYLEPYLIRSMQAARPFITDARLVVELDLFNGQEGQHYKQHIAFNQAIHVSEFPRLAQLEAKLHADYQRYTASRSLKWNLAYAEGFEAFTTALARFAFDTKLTDRMALSVRELFTWHMLEELEHRAVAFDVYNAVCGGYFFRLWVGLCAQWHLSSFLVRAASALSRMNPIAHRQKYGGRFRAWQRVGSLLWRMAKGFVPKLLATYLPWYSPHRIVMSSTALALAQHYSQLALAAKSQTEST